MLILPDAWTWDFWVADDGARFHLFFLRWYESADLGPDPDRWDGVAWRVPWVFAHPDGNGWHLLITARGRDGEALERGPSATRTPTIWRIRSGADRGGVRRPAHRRGHPLVGRPGCSPC
jgi:hypothetical protein